MKIAYTLSFLLLLLGYTNAAESEDICPPLLENVLQKLNTDGQENTPAVQQSGVMPLNIDIIRKTISDQPNQNRWGGVYTQTYFGIAVVPIPKTDLKRDIRPMIRNRAVLLASNEAAFVKAFNDYIANGQFDDIMLFQHAYVKAYSNYAFKGTYQKTAEFTFDEGENIVGIVAVLNENINVTIEEKTEIALLKEYLALLRQKTGLTENAWLKESIALLQQKIRQGIVVSPSETPSVQLPLNPDTTSNPVNNSINDPNPLIQGDE